MTENVITKCGFVALIGAPNAGKSTLLNQLVGGKVAIVSSKVQTTRTRVTGLMLHHNAQIIFVDTPGIFVPEKRLDRAMVGAAWDGVDESDVVAVLVDVTKKRAIDATLAILERLKKSNKKTVLLLNKVDAVKKEILLDLAQVFTKFYDFERIFMISALKNKGVSDVLDYFAKVVPEGPFLYPEDDMTTMPMRLLAAELTREKIFEQLYQELPYSCTVETDAFNESDPAKWVIEQTIFVQRESQRAIILGHQGQQLKKIGMAARKDMQAQFGVPVHLALFVKVREDWTEDPERYRVWGLNYKA
jgi:GTP-binding protein Era